MYSESPLSPVAVAWRSAHAAPALVPADGCADVILHGDHVFLAGPSTRAIPTLEDPEGLTTLGLRFAPGAAAAALGVELRGTADQRVPLAELVPRAHAQHIREAMLRARGPGADARAILRDRVAERVHLGARADGAWSTVVRAHARHASPASAVASALGWAPRTFRRRMAGSFGYSYGTLVRIERLRTALELVRHGSSLADAAAGAGYADQPHLSREVRRLAGTTPSQLAASSA